MSVYEITLLLNGEQDREERIREAFEKVVARNGAALKRLADSDNLITHNGKQYRKVKRNAAVGDLVLVTNRRGGEYREGEVLTVIEALYEHTSDAFPGILSKEYPEYDSWLYHNEYETLELVEQSGQSETLTERDLLANLAQEVAELKRQLTNAQTDIADLEDRVDENEKDTEELGQNVEEVIGRINDLGDGAEAAAVVSVEVIEKVLAELKVKQSEATLRCSKYENMGEKELAQFYDGKELGFKTAIRKIEEALRNG